MSTSVTSHRTSVQLAATVVGAVFLVVGILGFVPGITSDVGGLGFAGHGSEAMLLGLFQVSVLHNIVHVLFGIAGLALGRSAGTARGYLIWGGAIYLVLFVYGLVFSGDMGANFVPLNAADNVLHLLLGVGMLVLGLVLGRRAVPAHH